MRGFVLPIFDAIAERPLNVLNARAEHGVVQVLREGNPFRRPAIGGDDEHGIDGNRPFEFRQHHERAAAFHVRIAGSDVDTGSIWLARR
jgi:hypothetical protein